MNVALVRDESLVDAHPHDVLCRGTRACPRPTCRQADVPEGASHHPPDHGTAPGLICPVGHKVIYAVPGVPYEMADMFDRGILPDLRRRMAEAAVDVGGDRQPGHPHVGDERVGPGRALAPRTSTAFGRRRSQDGPTATIAFLASGIEGIKVRVTVRPLTTADADRSWTQRRPRSRAPRRAGDVVFGVDDEAIETAVAREVVRLGLTLGLAESLTGGLVASRLVGVAGASAWFRGSVVSYASEVKFDVLGVPAGPVVSEEAARAMAEGPAGCSGPTWLWPSPAWPAPTPRRAWPPAPCSSASPVPAMPWSRSSYTSPGTASGCASTRRSRRSTCCAGGSWPASPPDGQGTGRTGSTGPAESQVRVA